MERKRTARTVARPDKLANGHRGSPVSDDEDLEVWPSLLSRPAAACQAASPADTCSCACRRWSQPRCQEHLPEGGLVLTSPSWRCCLHLLLVHCLPPCTAADAAHCCADVIVAQVQECVQAQRRGSQQLKG